MIRHVNRVEREPFEFKRLVRTVETRRQIFFRFSCDVRAAWRGRCLWISHDLITFYGFPRTRSWGSSWIEMEDLLRSPPAICLSLTSRLVSDRISIGRRLSTPFVIRENLETRSTLVPYATVRNDHLGWPCEHDVKLTGRTACQPLSILFPTSVLTYR